MENIVNKLKESEAFKDICVLSILLILTSLNCFELLGDKVTPILLLLIVVQYGFAKMTLDKDKELCKKSLIISTVLIFFELLGISLRKYLFEDFKIDIISISRLAVVSIVLSIIVEPVIFGIISNIQIERDTNNKFNKKQFLILWISMICVYMPCIMAFYPGLLNYDSLRQWAMGMEHGYITQFSLIHNLFINLCVKLSNIMFNSNDYTMLFYNIVQIPLITGSIAFSIAYLDKLNVHKYVKCAILSYYILLPIYSVLTLSATNDAMFGGMYLIIIIILSEAIRTKTINKKVLIISLILGGLLNNKFIYAMIIFCIILSIRKKDRFRLRLITCLIVSTVSIIGINKGIQLITKAETRDVKELLNIPCQQVARTICYNKVNLNNYENLLEVLDWQDCLEYDVIKADNLRSNFRTDIFKDKPLKVISDYIRLGLKYPSSYIKAYVLQNIGLWWGDEETSYLLELTNRSPYDARYRINDMNILPLFRGYYRLFTPNKVHDKLYIVRRLFYTGTYVWLSILSLIVMIIKNKKEYTILPIFMLCYIFVISFGPYIYTRYLFNIMMCTPFLIGLTIFGMKEAS